MDPKDLKDLRDHMDGRFDRLDTKLDGHLERITVVETDTRWMKSQGKYIWMLLLGAVGKLAHLTLFKP